MIIEGIQFYTVRETATALGVTPQTVRGWAKSGRLKSQRMGRPILITRANLLSFLESTRVPATPLPL